MNLFSYIVRYDSGFAPNPFYDYCTLATCKPSIRGTGEIGDWIVGCGSADKKINQGGKLVYVLQISEKLSKEEYWNDTRFQNKKPNLNGSKKQSRGDNIYHQFNNSWKQLNSFHSKPDGSVNMEHLKRDTKVDIVLIGEKFIYFGCRGPSIPKDLASNKKTLCHTGQGHSKFSTDEDKKIIEEFLKWIESLNATGFVGEPFDW